MRRVLVIGSPGAGKSTLAADIARLTGLPLIHLDQHYWRSGWIEPPKEEWLAKVRQLIAGDRWIMDGNYGGSLRLRLTRADTVVHLDLPAWLCVTRILRRIVGSWRKVRPDMAEGCPEQFSAEFILYTATFRIHRRERVMRMLDGFTGRIITLKNASEVRSFLASLDHSG